ncbi:MAG: peptide chain release factor N(5)-glutamine methyltransferase [Phycisphaerae bacterium]
MTQSTTIWTVASLMQWTQGHFERLGVDEPRLSTELLLAHALGCDRMQLYVKFDAQPDAATRERFRELVKQRAQHVPVAYLTRRGWFYALEFNLEPGVLIPRPDTETLVEQTVVRAKALAALPAMTEQPLQIADVCTGSGCVAITLAKFLPTATVVATDISPEAIRIATANALRHKLDTRVTFYPGDLLEPLATLGRQFHFITANPPYIPSATIATLAAQVKDHEPHLALDGGADGLDFYRRIIPAALPLLAEAGWLLLEIGHDQAEAVTALTGAVGGYTDISVVRDAARNPRVLCARKA